MKMNSPKATRIKILNWHKIGQSQTLDIGDCTTIAGLTGQGKTTLIDAIYAGITLDYLSFNKAADEKSKRNLESYVRCRVDEIDSVTGKKITNLRTGKVISAIAIEFKNPKGNNFALVSHFTSANDNAKIDLNYFLIRNLTHFEKIEFVDNDKIPYTYQEFFRKLISNFGAGNVDHYDAKKNALKAWSSALGFDKYSSDDFVNANNVLVSIYASKVSRLDPCKFLRIVLPEKKIDTKLLVDAQDEYDKLKNIVDIADKKSEQITELKKISDTLFQLRDELLYKNIESNYANKRALEEYIVQTKKSISLIDDKISKLTLEAEDLEKQKTEITKQLFELRGDSSFDVIEDLKKKLSETENALNQNNSRWEKLSDSIAVFNTKISEINNVIGKQLFAKSISADDVRYGRINIDEIINIARYYANKVDEINAERTAECNNIKNSLKEKEEQCEYLKKGLAILEGNYKRGYDLLAKFYADKGIDEEPKMLYQFLDIEKKNAKRWQQPIESMLGAARFNFIVEPKYFQDVFNLLKISKLSGVSLINSCVLNTDKPCQKDSVCSLITFSNKYAERYVKNRFGNVIAVDKFSTELDPSKQYLCGDGTTSFKGSVTPYNKRVNLYIGADARQETCEKLTEEIQKDKDKMLKLKSLINRGTTLKESLSVFLSELMAFDKTVLNQIDLLDDKIKSIKAEISEYESLNNLNEKLNMLNKLSKNSESLSEKISLKYQEIGSNNADKNNISKDLLSSQNKYSALCDSWNNYECEFPSAAETVAKQCEAEVAKYASKTYQSHVSALELMIKDIEKKIFDVNTELKSKTMFYNNVYQTRISINDKTLSFEINKEFENSGIRNATLLRQELKEAADNLSSVIYNNYLNGLRENINEAKYKIKKYNNFLKDRKFSNRRYEINKVESAYGFEEVYDLVINCIHDEDNRYIHRRTGEEISREKLNAFAVFITDTKNERFTDYRECLRFDVSIFRYDDNNELISHKLLSDNSCGSGGETEIPFYILSALHLFIIYDESSNMTGVKPSKLLLLDEPFKKMDKNSIHSVLDFFKDLGFQTIISSPESMDDIISKEADQQIRVVNTIEGRDFYNTSPSYYCCGKVSA